MDIRYVRDMSYHHMVITLEEEQENRYPVQMILQNQIPGLLRVHKQVADGKAKLYYEITSMQSLQAYYESAKITMEEIRSLLLYISHVALELERYLLPGVGLLLHPEYIFTNTEHTQIYFCYFPGKKESVSEGINGIARFILDHIDYENRNNVELAYQLFQLSMEQNYSIQDFTKIALEKAGITTEEEADGNEVKTEGSENAEHKVEK